MLLLLSERTSGVSPVIFNDNTLLHRQNSPFWVLEQLVDLVMVMVMVMVDLVMVMVMVMVDLVMVMVDLVANTPICSPFGFAVLAIISISNKF